MCFILNVPGSPYYSKKNLKKSEREIENEKLKPAILKYYKESKCRYGAPKIKIMLSKNGFNISIKRTQRLMRELGIKSIIIKKYKPTSKKKPKEGLENLLKRDFTTTSINEKWVGDITYIKTQKDGWCYLASVLDLHSKKIVGYSFGKNMTNDLVIAALKNACYLQDISKDNKIIFHSDLGSQYTSNDMKNLCNEFNIIQSFSQKGCPYDNACIESFHAVLKKEEVYRNTYEKYEDAKKSIFQYIESFYNSKRLHSALDYNTPNEVEFKALNAA
uniref:Transposase n=1 Tax=Clostridium perfringens TaxID=1502 RepID=A0A0K2Y4M5_CLOPF|nr:transposase [Clostridium perfringens]